MTTILVAVMNGKNVKKDTDYIQANVKTLRTYNMTERFTVEESENQLTIYDYNGLDDYYHLGNDTRDVKSLCRLINELHEENEANKKIIKEQKKKLDEYYNNRFECILCGYTNYLDKGFKIVRDFQVCVYYNPNGKHMGKCLYYGYDECNKAQCEKCTEYKVLR